MATNEPNLKRAEIEAVAKELGATDWAIRKWWEREGVPAKWQLDIMRHSKGKIGLPDFASVAPERAA